MEIELLEIFVTIAIPIICFIYAKIRSSDELLDRDCDELAIKKIVLLCKTIIGLLYIVALLLYCIPVILYFYSAFSPLKGIKPFYYASLVFCWVFVIFHCLLQFIEKRMNPFSYYKMIGYKWSFLLMISVALVISVLYVVVFNRIAYVNNQQVIAYNTIAGLVLSLIFVLSFYEYVMEMDFCYTVKSFDIKITTGEIISCKKLYSFDDCYAAVVDNKNKYISKQQVVYINKELSNEPLLFEEINHYLIRKKKMTQEQIKDYYNRLEEVKLHKED